MRKPTPAKRLHKLAASKGLTIDEFSPGLRIWTVRDKHKGHKGEPLAFGVPQLSLAAKLEELGAAKAAAEAT